MKIFFLRLIRNIPPLYSLALIVCLPFFFAHAGALELPPSVNYILPGREEEREKQTAPQVQECKLCTSWQNHALQKLLGQYKEIAENGGWPQWKMGKTLHAGDKDARMQTLRQILTITGDYPSIVNIKATDETYDAVTAQAVMHFQSRHGLNADGALGKSTQMALAIPVEKRLSQIMATLVRLESHPITPETKFILVNLPAYTLYGIENDKENITMRVIVGNRANHTPLFDNQVTDVVFNPPWSVPNRIARNELIPKLRENPGYFIRAGFTITQDGETIDPMNVRADSDDFSFRQRPGTGNALGKIKFNIPNADNIYLHSTASPQLFAKEDRALSHGCIRLEKPRDLAYFVFGGNKGWDSFKVDHSYDSRTQRSVKVEQVPVHLVYWTAFVDTDGTPHFYNDVYNKDAGIMAAQLKHKDAVMMAEK
jgi:murein L,D-transpeptidase YcbB/YkuD